MTDTIREAAQAMLDELDESRAEGRIMEALRAALAVKDEAVPVHKTSCPAYRQPPYHNWPCDCHPPTPASTIREAAQTVCACYSPDDIRMEDAIADLRAALALPLDPVAQPIASRAEFTEHPSCQPLVDYSAQPVASSPAPVDAEAANFVKWSRASGRFALADLIERLTAERDEACGRAAFLRGKREGLMERIGSIAIERYAAIERAAAAERDAERYRWLTSESIYWVVVQSQPTGSIAFNGCPSELDAAIDAAMVKP